MVPTHSRKHVLSTVLPMGNNVVLSCSTLARVTPGGRERSASLRHQRKPWFSATARKKKRPVGKAKAPFCASLWSETVRLAEQKLNRPLTPLSKVRQSARLIAPGAQKNFFSLHKIVEACCRQQEASPGVLAPKATQQCRVSRSSFQKPSNTFAVHFPTRAIQFFDQK